MDYDVRFEVMVWRMALKALEAQRLRLRIRFDDDEVDGRLSSCVNDVMKYDLSLSIAVDEFVLVAVRRVERRHV